MINKEEFIKNQLKFSAFEEYLIRDESPCCSMTIAGEWHFTGIAQKAELEKSFFETIKYEPLFLSIAKKKWGKHFWEKTEVLPEFIWHDASTKVFFKTEIIQGILEVEPLNIFNDPPLRVELTQYADALVVNTFVHHCAADGIGFSHFMGNWFALYGNLVGDCADDLRPSYPNPAEIKNRGTLNLAKPKFKLFPKITASVWQMIIYWLFHHPLTLCKEIFQAKKDKVNACQIWAAISEQTVTKLRNIANRENISFNSILIERLFIFLKKWKSENNDKKNISEKIIRVLMPINLRNKFHDKIPASNIIGYIFLDRKLKNCEVSKKFTADIHQEIKSSRDFSIGAIFINAAKLALIFPPILNFFTSERFCHTTTVFSNIGTFCVTMGQKRFQQERTIRSGNLILQNAIIAPPVRPYTPISIATLIVKEKVILSMNTHHSFLQNEAGEKFFNEFLEFLNLLND